MNQCVVHLASVILCSAVLTGLFTFHHDQVVKLSGMFSKCIMFLKPINKLWAIALSITDNLLALCEGKPRMTGLLTSQMSSNAQSASTAWPVYWCNLCEYIITIAVILITAHISTYLMADLPWELIYPTSRWNCDGLVWLKEHFLDGYIRIYWNNISIQNTFFYCLSIWHLN